MTHRHPFIVLALVALTSTATAVDFASQITPIFRNKCYACHSVTRKVKGKLALDNDKISEQIGPGNNIIPGEPMKSTLFISCTLDNDDSDVMPPDGKNRLTDAEVELLKNWIAEGANLTGGGAAPAAAPATAMPAAGGLMKWTSSDGKVIEAAFERLEGDGVVLTMPGKGSFLVPLSRLSPESQEQAKTATK
ncbi:MAG: c-type cytochrome domain-containing protein [Prosthecobacter sp.]